MVCKTFTYTSKTTQTPVSTSLPLQWFLKHPNYTKELIVCLPKNPCISQIWDHSQSWKFTRGLIHSSCGTQDRPVILSQLHDQIGVTSTPVEFITEEENWNGLKVFQSNFPTVIQLIIKDSNILKSIFRVPRNMQFETTVLWFTLKVTYPCARRCFWCYYDFNFLFPSKIKHPFHLRFCECNIFLKFLCICWAVRICTHRSQTAAQNYSQLEHSVASAPSDERAEAPAHGGGCLYICMDFKWCRFPLNEKMQFPM